MARRAPAAAVAALIVAYVAVFGFLTVRQQARFGTFGFDMGIHDQGIWLLSRFRDPFVTVRGLSYFGHHLNLICLLLVPAYWLGAGPPFLFLVETVALAAGAVPVYLLARDALGDDHPWAPVVPAAAYLLYPTLEWIDWWHFHPEALALTPLLFAVWLGRRRRWGWFAVAVVLALAAKEDIALAVAVLGVVLAVSGRRETPGGWRPGAITAGAGVVWYVVATQVLMRAANGGQAPFYVQEFFPQFGSTMPAVVWAIVRDPAHTWRLLTEAHRLTYYDRLLAPTGFLALGGIPVLLVAGPQLGANALSALPTTYDARFHYSVVPTAAVFAATVQTLGRLRRRGSWLLRIGLVVLVVGTAWTHRQWAPSPAGRPFRSGVWVGPNPRQHTFERALARVPAEGSLATSYFLVPHATHRPSVYEWPNPWIPGNWGFANRDPDDPGRVDWLVLDLRLDQQPALVARLTSGPDAEFAVVSEDEGVLVAKRVRRPVR